MASGRRKDSKSAMLINVVSSKIYKFSYIIFVTLYRSYAGGKFEHM